MKVGIDQLIAPIKLMILIKPDDKDRFSRAMQLASCCWGGMHVPIFPFYEELPRDYREEYCITIPAASYYKNLLSNYDPDVLVYDEDLSVDLIKTIGEGLKAVTVESLMEELKEARNDHSIGIYEVAIYLRENEFKFTRADGVQFALPKFKENCLLLDAMFCRLPDDENERLKLIFKGNSAFIEPILDWENAETYRNLSVIDPLMTISYQLRPYGNLRQEFGSAYYPMRRNRLRDVMNYWNLRASGWHILPIALDLLDANYFYQATKRFISRRQSSYGAESMFFINILAAKSISERLSRMVFQNLAGDNLANNKRLMYSYQPWFPRYWSEYETLKADHVKAVLVIKDSHFDHYDSEDAYLRIPIKPMNLQWEGNVSRNTSYKIILQWDLYDEQAEYAELLSGISQKQFIRLVSPMDFRNTRLSPAGIHKPVRQGDRDITLVVPKAEPFFRAYFSTLNHNLVETSNSKLASEVLRNIGGITGANFFLRLGTLKIIELFEGGKIIAYSTLIAEIKKMANWKI
jgi:hypothetical protein